MTFAQFAVWTGLVLCSVFAATANGDLIFQSAVVNEDPNGGTGVSSSQWLGAAFSVSQPTQITSVGGQFIYVEGDLFAAIVPLSSLTSVPAGDEFTDTTVLAETTFTPSFTGGDMVNDYQTPLSVMLAAGNYGLVFGSGEFGATGDGGMTYNSFIGSSHFISTDLPGGWTSNSFYPARFVVYGTVPEPVSVPVFMSVISLLVLRPRRFQRQ